MHSCTSTIGTPNHALALPSNTPSVNSLSECHISYEGKKSALAAAAISKDCPYQHQGVLFHAEVTSPHITRLPFHEESDVHTILHNTFHSFSQLDFEELQEGHVTLEPVFVPPIQKPLQRERQQRRR